MSAASTTITPALTPPPADIYIHGTHPEEQDRLRALNELMNEASLREMALAGHERVLEVGSGLGQLARQMARRVAPLGHVLGIERSAEQIAGAQRLAAPAGEAALVEFREGDAQAMPLRDNEWGTFDVAHTRFVLEHVPNPQRVVSQMVRAVRPGGRVILQDTDHSTLRMTHAPESFAALWRAYLGVYDAIQCNPFVARELPHLLVRAGARPYRTTVIPYATCSGASDFWPFVEHFIDMMAGARPQATSLGLMAPAAFDRAISDLRAWACRPDVALWFPMTWIEGRRLDGLQ